MPKHPLISIPLDIPDLRVLQFQACLPLLTRDASAWLRQALQLAHPEGHPWLALLAYHTAP